MEIKIFLTIFCLLAFSLVNCYCSQYDEYDDSNYKVTKFFASADNIVNVYNKELDVKIKWKDLNAAITALDDFLVNYQGSARDNMKDLRVTNADAYNNYVFAVQPIVNWCSSINRSLNFVINKLAVKNSLTPGMREVIARKLAYMVKTGTEKLKFSIQKIENAIRNITRLHTTAKDMEYKLVNDFEPEGYYGRRKADLRSEISKKKALAGGLAPALGILGGAASIILGFTMGPVGVALGLFGTFSAVGIPTGVILGHEIPSLEEQIKIIDTFFTTLEKELKRTQEAAKVVKDGLEKESREINSLDSKTVGTEPSDIKASDLDDEFSETLQSLRVECVKYVQSHGVTCDDKRRRKRDMTSIAIDTLNSTHRMTFTAPLNTDENNFIIPQIEN